MNYCLNLIFFKENPPKIKRNFFGPKRKLGVRVGITESTETANSEPGRQSPHHLQVPSRKGSSSIPQRGSEQRQSRRKRLPSICECHSCKEAITHKMFCGCWMCYEAKGHMADFDKVRADYNRSLRSTADTGPSTSSQLKNDDVQ